MPCCEMCEDWTSSVLTDSSADVSGIDIGEHPFSGHRSRIVEPDMDSPQLLLCKAPQLCHVIWAGYITLDTMHLQQLWSATACFFLSQFYVIAAKTCYSVLLTTT